MRPIQCSLSGVIGAQKWLKIDHFEGGCFGGAGRGGNGGGWMRVVVTGRGMGGGWVGMVKRGS